MKKNENYPKYVQAMRLRRQNITYVDVMSDEGFKRVFGMEENMIHLPPAADQTRKGLEKPDGAGLFPGFHTFRPARDASGPVAAPV
jgi:hypothetical protein